MGSGEVWKEGITRQHEKKPFGGDDMFTILIAVIVSQVYTYIKTSNCTL